MLCVSVCVILVVLFFLSMVANLMTPTMYALSLHDALPIFSAKAAAICTRSFDGGRAAERDGGVREYFAHGARDWTRDRKSTRLNSSHANISYAVFCLKKTK